MASKAARRRDGRAAGRTTVKTTLRLSLATAQRLGVESAMTRESQSDIAERVLSAHLSRWRLPSTVGNPADSAQPAQTPADRAD